MQPQMYSNNPYPTKPHETGEGYEYNPRSSYGIVYHGYSKGISIGLGVTQIIFGSLALILNSVGMSRQAHSLAGIGVWGGLFIAITGMIGIVAGIKRTRCPVIGFLVCAIISLILAILIAVTAGFGVDADKSGNKGSDYYRRWYVSGYDIEARREERVAWDVVVMVAAILEIPIAIITIIYVSRHVCCGDSHGALVPNRQEFNPGLPREMPAYQDQPAHDYHPKEAEKKGVPGLPYGESSSRDNSMKQEQGPYYGKYVPSPDLNSHHVRKPHDSNANNVPRGKENPTAVDRKPIFPLSGGEFESEPYGRKSAGNQPSPLENQGAYHHIEGPVHSGHTLKRKSQENDRDEVSQAQQPDNRKSGIEDRPQFPLPIGVQKRGPPPPLETSVTESDHGAPLDHSDLAPGQSSRSGRNKTQKPHHYDGLHPDQPMEMQSLDNSRLNQSHLSRASTERSHPYNTSMLSGAPLDDGERRVQGFNFGPSSRASSTKDSLPPFRPAAQPYRPQSDAYFAYGGVPYEAPPPQQPPSTAYQPPAQPYRPPAVHRHT